MASSGFGLLSDLMGMKESQERIRTYQTLNKQREEALADEAAIRAALQRNTPAPAQPRSLGSLMGPAGESTGVPIVPLGQPISGPTPGPAPEPNFGRAISDLYREGRGTAAVALQTELLKLNKERLADLKNQNDDVQARLATASRLAQGITDEDSFNRALPRIKSLVGEGIASQFGSRYDPEVISQIIAQGRDAQSHLTSIRDAFTQAESAFNRTQGLIKDEREWAEKQDQMFSDWTGVGSQLLSIARSQEDWDTGRDMIRSGTSMFPGNFTNNVLVQFGEEFSPEAVEKARLLGMSQSERSTERRDWQRIADAQRRAEEMDDARLSPEAADMLARNFAYTGQLPAMGMGSNAAANRIDVFNRAAEIFRGVDIPTQTAIFKSYAGSLNAIQKSIDAIDAYERTAQGNLQQFVTAASNIVDTGSPLINRPLRSFSQQVLGSTNMAAYNTARRVVIPEIARLLTSANLGNVLSDSARQEVESLMTEDATLAQAVTAANVILNDMNNRKQSYEQQIEFMQSRMANAPRLVQEAGGGLPQGLEQLTGTGTQTDPYEGPTPPTQPRMGAFWNSPNGLTRWNGQMWAIMQGAQ